MSVSFNKGRLPDKDPRATLNDMVQTARASKTPDSARSDVRAGSLPDEFCRRFKRTLRTRETGSSAEERFALVFSQTLHEVPVSSKEAGRLYLELIDWAKQAHLGFETLQSGPRSKSPR